MTDQDPSNELTKFVLATIDRAHSPIKDTSGPVIPFALIVDQSGDEKTLLFAVDTLEQAVKEAQTTIDRISRAQAGMNSSKSIVMYAIAFDGWIAMDGKNWNAILIEAGEAGLRQGFLFCQRYKPFKKKFFLVKAYGELVGKPMIVDRQPSRLWVESAV